MTMLAGSGLTVRRGGRAILDGVDFRAERGEFIAVIGANGAGKSTLLSVLAGLLPADAGSVELEGRALSTYSGGDLARRRAYLPQNPRCEWPLTVERLVALGLTASLPAFGKWTSADQCRIDEALRQCDLLAHRDQPATTLSGGELMRAMLARTFVGDPAILIVDEPIAGLDPRHALDTLRRLRERTQGGTLVIASLHGLSLVARFASRVIVLRDGKLDAEGSPEQVLTSDTIRRAFEVEAELVQGKGGLYIGRVGGGALDLSHAGHRPPLKLDVQFSRIQLS